MNFSASDLERLKRNLPRFRPGEEGVAGQYQSQPSNPRVDLESSIEKRLFDKLIGPLAPPPTSSRAPRVGSAGMSLRPSALGDLSAGGGPLLGHLKQSAISTPSAGTVSSPPHATSSSGSSGSSPPTQPYSGAGGGLMGVLASRLNTVEEESVALRSLLSARERDVVVRDKELLALRRQLETALSEARTARQDSNSPVRMLHTSSGSRGGVSTSSATATIGGLSVVGKAGIAMGSPSSSLSGGGGGGGGGLLHSSSPSLQGVPSPTKGPSPLSPSNSTSATATATASTPFPLATTSTVGDTLMAREATLRAQLARVREELEEVVVDRGELREELEEALGEMRDMKKFLADYGLVWVGGGGKGGGSSAGGGGGGGVLNGSTTNAPFPPLLSSSFSPNAPNSSSVGGEGAPSTTTASNPPLAPSPIDFPFLAFRVQQLNALAGEGKSRVVSKDGAHQLVSEPVGGRLKLTLHRDGFLLRRGPFRPYTRESSRLFIQDILDGFFPYELKESYPEGVLFDLVNKTTEWYEGGGGKGGYNGHGSASGASHGGEGEGVGEVEGEGGVHPGFVPFGGSGRSLRDIPKGGSTTNSNTTTTTDKRVTRLITMGGGGGSGGGGGEEELFHLPSPPRAFPPPPTTAGSSSGSITASALLSALPSKVVSSRGDMVDVRGSVAHALGMEVGGPPSATPATTAGNATAAATATAPTSSSISTSTATIKVRLDGSPAPPPLLLHLRADEDTVGYLLSCVAGHRVTDTPFELRSAAPARAFSAGGRDVGLTLRQAGLAPSAVLFVRSAV